MNNSKFYFFQILLFIVFIGFFLIFFYLDTKYTISNFTYFFLYTLSSFFLLLYVITKIQKRNYLPLIKSLQDLQKGYFTLYLPLEKQDFYLKPLAHEILLLSHQLKLFEHLRIQKIHFEQKKFEILAEKDSHSIFIIKDKKIIYMNSFCLEQLDLQKFFSDDYTSYTFSQEQLNFIENSLKTDSLENESSKSILSYGKMWPLRTQEQDYYLFVLNS